MLELRTPLLAAALASLSACAAPLQVSVDRDENVELTALCSYAWVSEGETSGQAIVEDNDLLEQRVKQAVFRQLEAKGLYQAAGGKPDLTVHVHAVMERKVKVVTHRMVDEAGGVSEATSEQTEVFTATEGTLLVDIHDGEEDALIWRGVARDLGDAFVEGGETLDAAIEEAVSKMFERYPPASSSCRERPGAPR